MQFHGLTITEQIGRVHRTMAPGAPRQEELKSKANHEFQARAEQSFVSGKWYVVVNFTYRLTLLRSKAEVRDPELWAEFAVTSVGKFEEDSPPMGSAPTPSEDISPKMTNYLTARLPYMYSTVRQCLNILIAGCGLDGVAKVIPANMPELSLVATAPTVVTEAVLTETSQSAAAKQQG